MFLEVQGWKLGTGRFAPRGALCSLLRLIYYWGERSCGFTLPPSCDGTAVQVRGVHGDQGTTAQVTLRFCPNDAWQPPVAD